jgi:uncharacterized protein YbaP (TraB family)
MINYVTGLLLLIFAHTCCANLPLWEVSHGDKKLWLGASLGALKKNAYPLPEAFNDAFSRADKLYVERDIHAVNQPDFGLRAMQASMYTDGRTLKTVLAPAVWQDLEQYEQKRDIPMFSLLMFKPAFAGFTLTALESKRLEFSNGVDAHYFYRARRANKPIVALETVDQQIQFLQKINEVDADLLIRTTLEELDNLSATLGQATELWRKGDMEKLDQLKGKKLRAEVPVLYRELVVNRNKAWVAQFNQMLRTPESEFILVDAMHLGGPDNLLQLLKAEGYVVKPYSYKASATKQVSAIAQ